MGRRAEGAHAGGLEPGGRGRAAARDTYGVDVAPGQDDVLFLAIAVALDRIQHDDEERER